MNNLDFLINYLLKEKNIKMDIPTFETDKFNLYKSLVNIRMPKEVSEEFLKKEDELLNDYFNNFEIVDYKNIGKEKLVLYKGDITKIKIDAIVNPANSDGLGCFNPNHNCLDNQITTLAGVRLRLEDKKEMDKIGNYLKTSNCFITKGYNLPCKYVIHVVGPIVDKKLEDYQKEELKNSYINVLNLAKEKRIKNIAFPSISTGIFNFPKNEAAKIAVNTVKDYLKEYDCFNKIVLVVYTLEDYNYYKEYL